MRLPLHWEGNVYKGSAVARKEMGRHFLAIDLQVRDDFKAFKDYVYAKRCFFDGDTDDKNSRKVLAT